MGGMSPKKVKSFKPGLQHNNIVNELNLRATPKKEHHLSPLKLPN